MGDAELYVVIVILLFIMFVLAIKLGQAHYKLDKQELKLHGLNFTNELNRIIAASKTENKKLQISKTTEQLLTLAVNNVNEHESRAAAVKACKRIYKELDIKS